jgi:sulfofructose kinase
VLKNKYRPSFERRKTVKTAAVKKALTACPEILVAGRNCLDHIAVIQAYPEEDTKQAIESRFVDGGGQAGTAACCIARLGGTPVLVGALGDDEDGRFCKERLDAFGVETGHVKVVAGVRTPVAYIFVTQGSGRRTIFYEPGQLPPVQPDDFEQALTPTIKTILLAPDVTYLASALTSREPDAPKIIYDCERPRKGLRQMMSLADFFIPSHDFFKESKEVVAERELKQRILQLQQMVAGQLVVTCGQDGAFFPYEHRLYHVPAPVIDVADTLGAGDSFHGAFALAIARGFDLKKAVRFSVAVASLSCREYGGRKGLPDMQQAKQTMARIQERVVDD